MEESTVVRLQPQETSSRDALTEVLHRGARRLLMEALEMEVESFLSEFQELRADGRPRALYLTAQRGHLLLTPEHRAAPAPDPIALRLRSAPDGTQTYLEVLNPGEAKPSTPPLPLEQRLLAVLHSVSRPLTRTEIRRQVRVNNQHLGQVLAQLEARGLLTRSQQGWHLAAQANANDPPTALSPPCLASS